MPSSRFPVLAAFYLYLHRIRHCVERDPSPDTEATLTPIDTSVSHARATTEIAS
jgi:hypothetical protein